jgi:hypothetical protein
LQQIYSFVNLKNNCFVLYFLKSFMFFRSRFKQEGDGGKFVYRHRIQYIYPTLHFSSDQAKLMFTITWRNAFPPKKSNIGQYRSNSVISETLFFFFSKYWALDYLPSFILYCFVVNFDYKKVNKTADESDCC